MIEGLRDEDIAVTIAATSLVVAYACDKLFTKRKKRKERKCWVKPWIASRDTQGAYQCLVTELSIGEHDEYQRFMRMDHDAFNVSALFLNL